MESNKENLEKYEVLSEEILSQPDFTQFLERNEEDSDLLKESLDILLQAHLGKKGMSPNEAAKKILKERPDEKRFDVLEKLYRLTAAYAIEKLKIILDEDPLPKIFSWLNNELDNENLQKSLNDFKHDFTEGEIEKLNQTIKEILRWREVLFALTIDKSEIGKEGVKIHPPFNVIPKDNREWSKCLDTAANFGHSFSSFFHIDNVATTLGTLFLLEEEFDTDDPLFDTDDPLFDSDDPLIENLPNLSVQAAGLDGFKKLLTGFQRQLLQINGKGDIKNWAFLRKELPSLLQARLSNKLDITSPLPIKVTLYYGHEGKKKRAPELNNVDESELLIALCQIANNAFSEGKISLDELDKYDNKDNPYLHIEVRIKPSEEGSDVILINVIDNGKGINVREIAQKLKKKKIKWSDVTEYISKKGNTVPVDDKSTELHTGTGLSTARGIIWDHRGDIMCINQRDAKRKVTGVKFYIAIPVQGKESPNMHVFVDNKLRAIPCGTEELGEIQESVEDSVQEIFDDRDEGEEDGQDERESRLREFGDDSDFGDYEQIEVTDIRKLKDIFGDEPPEE